MVRAIVVTALSKKLFGKNKYFFLCMFAKTFGENIKHDKCAPHKDARDTRTCVINTKNTRVWSKTPIFILKMLNIRKK